MNQVNVIPTKLQEVAGNRDFLSTHETATALNKARQTLLKEFCLKGHAYGIRPKKIGGRLLWSVSDIQALLNGEA
jgi:hypothetical protein